MNTDFINICLADDDEDDRLFFTDAFDELKINTKVSTFNDGVELMNYLNDDARRGGDAHVHHAHEMRPVSLLSCTLLEHHGHGLGFLLAASHGLCLARVTRLPSGAAIVAPHSISGLASTPHGKPAHARHW